MGDLLEEYTKYHLVRFTAPQRDLLGQLKAHQGDDMHIART
jgi:hypothetical protein